MAVFTNHFDSYQIFYYGGTAPSPKYQAVIQVYQGDIFAGQMVFFRAGSPLDPNKVIAPLGTDTPQISYPIASFDELYEMLRHIKPLYLFLDSSTLVGMLATAQSIPVGEEEGQ